MQALSWSGFSNESSSGRRSSPSLVRRGTSSPATVWMIAFTIARPPFRNGRSNTYRSSSCDFAFTFTFVRDSHRLSCTCLSLSFLEHANGYKKRPSTGGLKAANSHSTPSYQIHKETMTETSRSLEAAAALSQVLTAHAIPHAFHGSILVSMLSKNPQCSVGIRLDFSLLN